MAFWELVTIGAIGALIHKSRKRSRERAEEERRRKSIACHFTDGISKEEFEVIARKAGKHIKRLTDLSVDGPVVYGTVRSQSGLSEWGFKADFNDYGHITGRYWLTSDNDDSSIPDHIADNISSMIISFSEDNDQSSEDSFYGNDDYYEDDISLEEEQENRQKLWAQTKLFKTRERKHTRKIIRLCLDYTISF